MTSARVDHTEANLRTALAGTYKVENELGRGAMARVFLAKDLRHDRMVAVKLLPPEMATASAAERFLREIRITATLQHPNILPLLDSGATSGLCWYVMPHVPGDTLRAKMSEGPLPLKDALKIAISVAQALGFAQSKGVIHRDIKPENILFSGGTAMVADFGLARAMYGTMGSTLTAVGMPLGTPAYMSPEQATGAQQIDHRTDLYALGCILYEMVSGRPPFVANSVTQMIRLHVGQVPAPLSSVKPGSPASLDDVVARLLAKAPEQRYQSAEDMITDLEMVAALETLERSTGTTSSHASPAMAEAMRASMAPGGAGMRASMAPGAGVRASMVPSVPVAPPAAVPTPAGKGIPKWVLLIVGAVLLLVAGYFVGQLGGG
jgi:serine/threonine-protein kinase